MTTSEAMNAWRGTRAPLLGALLMSPGPALAGSAAPGSFTWWLPVLFVGSWILVSTLFWFRSG